MSLVSTQYVPFNDHFNKNAHSRMRVHLSTQILSQNVAQMLRNDCGTDKESKFDSLLIIWNHSIDKEFKRYPNENCYECIDGCNHKYIMFLEKFLAILNFWRAETTIYKTPNRFMPLTLFERFFLLA